MTTGTIAQPAQPAGLKARVIRAGSWIMGGTFVAQALRLATNVFVAKLLFPDAFGLMAVVYMLATALALFSDLGVSRTVVLSTRGTDPVFLDTAWTIQCIRTQCLALAVLVAAGVVEVARRYGLFKAGTTYADPRLPPLIAGFAIVLVFQGLESIRLLQAKRDMRIHSVTKIDMSGQVASAVTMIAVAWKWHSVWALLVGGIVAGAVRCLLGYRTLPGHTARFRIDRESAKELMGHAKWIVLSSIMGFLAVNGDRVLLGGLVTSRDFGLYSIAIIIVNVLQSLANSLCNSVVFPALSEVHRDRPQELSKSIQKFQWAFDGMVVLPASILITAGPTLIALMYDARYSGAGWMLAMLAVGVIGVRYQIVEVAYLAVAKTKYGALANMLRLAALVGGLLIGSHVWGLTGAIAGVALSQYAAWPLAIWFKRKVHALSWRAEALLVPCIVAGLALGTGLSMVLRLLFPHHLMR